MVKIIVAVSMMLATTCVLTMPAMGEDKKFFYEPNNRIAVLAQNSQPDLEIILEGFDDSETAGTILDDVLDGFDEDEKKATKADTKTEDMILEGFDDDTKAIKTPTPASSKSVLPYSLDGYLKLAGTYNYRHETPGENETDWRGLSKWRFELLGQAEYKPVPDWKIFVSAKGHYDAAYAINGRDDYTDDVLDINETELEFRDTYLSGSLTRNLDIKLGKQIVVWGKSDNIRITDVLNPLDFREPGLTDIEDLRLPLFMSRMDYYIKNFSFTGIAIHEIRFDKLPAFGSDFYPFDEPPPDEKIPANTLDNTEFAAAANGIFSGWDLSFYWANIYNDTARIKMGPPAPVPTFNRTHDRIHMIGSGLNVVFGNWLLKIEAAYFTDLKYFNTGSEKFSRIDGLIGFEYTGLKDTSISLEVSDRHLLDFDENLENAPDNIKEDESQTAIRLTRDFLNDTLSLTILVNFFGSWGEDGAFQRLTLEYDLTDAVSILGGVVLYQSGDTFEDVDDNDRLIFEAKYFF